MATGATPLIITIEERLAMLRKGVAQTFQIRVRDLEFTARILLADEQARLESEAGAAWRQLPQDQQTDPTLLLGIRRGMLIEASKVDGIPTLPPELLRQLTWDEVHALYSELMSKYDLANPSLDKIDLAEVEGLIEEAKKDPSRLNEYSLMQLHALARRLLVLLSEAEQTADDSPSLTDSPSGST